MYITNAQLKKCLIASASALSALGLMVAAPRVASAQTGGQTQTGVEGSQINPGSEDGTGQSVPPPITVEGTSGTMTPGTGTRPAGTMMPSGSGSTLNDGNIDDGGRNERDSDTGRGEAIEDVNTGAESDMMRTTPSTTTMPSTTIPSTRTTPSSTTPSTTATPSTSNSPRALW